MRRKHTTNDMSTLDASREQIICKRLILHLNALEVHQHHHAAMHHQVNAMAGTNRALCTYHNDARSFTMTDTRDRLRGAGGSGNLCQNIVASTRVRLGPRSKDWSLCPVNVLCAAHSKGLRSVTQSLAYASASPQRAPLSAADGVGEAGRGR